MLDVQAMNATATVYERVQTETEDSYGDTVTQTEYQSSQTGIPVRYEPKGTEYVQSETGDTVQRSERVFAPLRYHDTLIEGAPIDISHMGQDLSRRIDSLQIRSIDGFEGYCQISLRDID